MAGTILVAVYFVGTFFAIVAFGYFDHGLEPKEKSPLGFDVMWIAVFMWPVMIVIALVMLVTMIPFWIGEYIHRRLK